MLELIVRRGSAPDVQTRRYELPHPPAVSAFLARLASLGAEVLTVERAGARIEVSWRLPGSDPQTIPMVTEFLAPALFALATMPVDEIDADEEGPDDEIAILPDALAIAAAAARASLEASGVVFLDSRR